MYATQQEARSLAGGQTLALRPVPLHQTKFDLTLYVEESFDGLALTASYQANLFDAGRIAELLEQYRRILEQAAQRPDDSVFAYSLATSQPRAVLPNPAEPLPEVWAGSVVERFRGQARREPDRIAVSTSRGDWSYGRLDAATDRLAAWLRDRGIGREDVVVIESPRCGGLAWATLGVWKAGAAFVLIDPALPADWRAGQVCTARPRGWITLFPQKDEGGDRLGEPGL